MSLNTTKYAKKEKPKKHFQVFYHRCTQGCVVGVVLNKVLQKLCNKNVIECENFVLNRKCIKAVYNRPYLYSNRFYQIVMALLPQMHTGLWGLCWINVKIGNPLKRSFQKTSRTLQTFSCIVCIFVLNRKCIKAVYNRPYLYSHTLKILLDNDGSFKILPLRKALQPAYFLFSTFCLFHKPDKSICHSV